MTSQEDIASVAAQLADLTHTVEEMAAEIKTLREGANRQQERSTLQHDRIDLAAQELHDVSERLQAASKALRESV